MFTGENVINIIIFESIIQPRFFFVLIKKIDYRKLDNFTLSYCRRFSSKATFIYHDYLLFRRFSKLNAIHRFSGCNFSVTLGRYAVFSLNA